MAGYITRNSQKLDVDDIPFWFSTYLRYLRAIRGYTVATQLTHYNNLKEFCKYIAFSNKYGHEPAPGTKLLESVDNTGKPYIRSVNELSIFRTIDISEFSLDTIASVSKKTVEEYRYFLADTLENESVTSNKKLSIIKTFYDYLVDEQGEFDDSAFAGYPADFLKINCLHVPILVSPATKIHSAKIKEKNPSSLTPVEVVRLLNAIEGENEVRDYFAILLAVSTGIRVSELCKINMNDFTDDTVLIHGKGNKERCIPITNACKEAMQRYLDEYRTPIAPNLVDPSALFVSKRSYQRIVPRTVQKFVNHYVVKAGMGCRNITPHTFRHTAATIMVNEGIDLLTVQRFLGHVSPQTTSKYTHLSFEKIREAVANSSLSKLGCNEISNEDLLSAYVEQKSQNRKDNEYGTEN